MADGSGSHGLKLLVTDDEDLKVASCCLQDALVPMFDICFRRSEQRFVMVVNRFKWEDETEIEAPAAEPGAAPQGIFHRTQCGVVFDGVKAVKCRGLDPLQRGQILELLAVERGAEGLLMHFAGGGCLRLETDRLQGRIEDIGECWPTVNRPCHVLDVGTMDDAVADGR